MRRSSMIWGALIILFGTLLLLQNLGYLRNVNLWGLAWPFFLIALGVWFLLGALSRRALPVEHLAIPLQGASRAELRLSHAVGRIQMAAGASADNLLEGDFGGGVDVKTRREGEQLSVKLKLPARLFPFDWMPGQSLDWTFSLAPQVPLRLELETGASNSMLDLSELQVNELVLKAGASSTVLTLPAQAGFTPVKVEAGAASLKIVVPAGVAVRIRPTGGLTSLNVDRQRFPLTDGAYQSPDYDSAANKVDIRIEMGVGSVSVV